MMVCGPQISPLTRIIDLSTLSSCSGEDQMDSPMPMHSYRSRCAATSPFAFSFGLNAFLPHVLPESCLLHWIQSSQENQARVEKAFKCPQCGADYEIESDNPVALRLLNKLNKILTSTGKVATLVGMGTTIFTFGTCASVSSGTEHRLTLYWKHRYLLDVHFLWGLGSPRVFGSGDVSL